MASGSRRSLCANRRPAAVASARTWRNFAIVALLLGVCTSCRSVPTDPIGPARGGNEATYLALIERARHHFEAQPRSADEVRRSADLYAQAVQIKSDEYATLWRAARTCAWLGEYLRSDPEREKFTHLGLRYANTARSVDARRVPGNYYHGVLSGLLGDLDHSYGLDAVNIIEQDII